VLVRPLFIVDNMRLLIKKQHIQKLLARDTEEEPFGWKDLVAMGLVEYIDTEVRVGG
jgi:DNA-directed RNA polymerase II subunit RPB2